jgi:hypothetical protein
MEEKTAAHAYVSVMIFAGRLNTTHGGLLVGF